MNLNQNSHPLTKGVKRDMTYLFYCVHIPTGKLCEHKALGGIEFTDNPNKATFSIKSAWEDRLKYRREDRQDFKIIEFKPLQP